jgi:hypothetical protein
MDATAAGRGCRNATAANEMSGNEHEWEFLFQMISVYSREFAVGLQ